MASFIPESVYENEKFQSQLNDVDGIVKALATSEDPLEKMFAMTQFGGELMRLVSIGIQLTMEAPKKEVKEWLDELKEAQSEDEDE